MGKANNEGEARANAQAKATADARMLDELFAAAAVEPPADPFNTDHALTDPFVELLERRSVRAMLMGRAGELLPTEAERKDVVAAVDDTVSHSWSDPLSWGYVWWGVIGQTREDYLRKRARLAILLRALRKLLPAAVPTDLRIEPKQAIERGAPEHGLRPIPSSTFYRWVRNPKNRDLLGIDKRIAKWAGQPVLVAGLLQLQASSRRGTKLPRSARNATLARAGSGRKGSR